MSAAAEAKAAVPLGSLANQIYALMANQVGGGGGGGGGPTFVG